jgi:DHA1 family inner membrane transport protein
VILFFWGAGVFGFGSPIQARIIGNTRDAPLLAASLIPSGFNVSIAFGAWLGGTMIDGGYGYGSLPWIGAVGAALSVAVVLWSWSRERKSVA